MGAAICAGAGVGAFAGIKEGVARMVKVDKRYEPNAENGNTYDELYRLYCKTYKALDEAGIFHQMK